MQYIWLLTFLCVISVGLMGCNNQKTQSEVEMQVYSETSGIKQAVYSNDEASQKIKAQSLTLGGRREDGLHHINYSNPNYMDIVIFTKRAKDYLRRNGVRRAIEDFMNPDSQFVAGRMYVFAYSNGGECLADWAEPKKVGCVGDYEFVRAARKAAEIGGGWINGVGVDPIERQMRQKESYVVYADDDIIIGAGLYKN